MRSPGARVGWRDVRREMRRRILSREWTPGDTIPNEAELAQELGCARATVNRALRALAEEGVLDRRRKAGTRLVEHPVRRAVLHIPVLREEIEAAGLAYGYRLIDARDRVPPAAAASRMGLGEGTAALRIRALHLGGGRPFVLEDRWLNTVAVPEARGVDFSALSANEWLIANVPFDQGSLQIGAVSANAELADRLGCDPGAALVRLERETRRGERAITLVSLTYRAGHSVLSNL